MSNPAKNSPIAEQVRDLISEDTNPVALKCTKIALTASDAAAGVFSWQNPHGSAIIIARVLVDLTTKATAAATIDVGTDGDGTGSSDNLIDGLDVNTATGVFDNMTDKGSNGKEMQRLDAKGGTTDYVTASKATGATAGIVGNAYVFYYEV